MRGPIVVLALALAVQVGPAVAAENEAKTDKAVARELKRCAPRTYEAAVDCLDRILPAKHKSALSGPDGAIEAHFGLGMFLRNNWGLWRQGPLYNSMRGMGFTHPDDMSGAILEGFAARARGEPYRPVAPDPTQVQAQWDQAVKEGRAGALSCNMPPLPTNASKKRVAAAMEACLDQMAESLKSDQK